MTSKLVALSASLVIGLAASSVHAEGDQSTGHVAAPPHPTPGKLDNGKISLTKLVPPLTKVFDYSGNIWDRTTLFGDFNGGRTRLYDKGFTFESRVALKIMATANTTACWRSTRHSTRPSWDGGLAA